MEAEGAIEPVSVRGSASGAVHGFAGHQPQIISRFNLLTSLFSTQPDRLLSYRTHACAKSRKSCKPQLPELLFAVIISHSDKSEAIIRLAQVSIILLSNS